MAADEVAMKVGSQIFDGWTYVEADRGIDNLVGAFTLGASDRWPGMPEDWGFAGGDACSLSIGDELVVTGWIDRPRWSIEPEEHPVLIAGLERTVDLTDCSALNKPGTWRNRRLEQIVADLAGPFDIAVTAKADTGAAFSSFSLQQGETVFNAIDRLCRQRAVLPVTTPAGDLEIIQPGQIKAGYELAVGKNLLAASFEDDMSERFSDYLIKGYALDGASRPKASIHDGAVGRYRPLLIVNDDEGAPGSLQQRARLEASTRAGRGQRVTARVRGWRDEKLGELYVPNRLVPVYAPEIGIEGELLIYSVSYRRDAKDGTQTVLSLAPKEAFGPGVIPAPRRRRRRSTPLPGASS